jgi:hypothetical protein
MENWSKHFGDRDYVSITDLLALEAKSNARAERLQKTGAPRLLRFSPPGFFIHPFRAPSRGFSRALDPYLAHGLKHSLTLIPLRFCSRSLSVCPRSRPHWAVEEFDHECSHAEGYIRQPVYACLTCHDAASPFRSDFKPMSHSMMHSNDWHPQCVFASNRVFIPKTSTRDFGPFGDTVFTKMWEISLCYLLYLHVSCHSQRRGRHLPRVLDALPPRARGD